jgi:hypothetical protein
LFAQREVFVPLPFASVKELMKAEEEEEEDEAAAEVDAQASLDGSAAAAAAKAARPKLGWLSAMLEAAIQQRAHQLLDAPLLFVSESTLVAFETRSSGTDGAVPLERTESATKPSALTRQRTLRRQLSLTPVDDALLAQLVATQPELSIDVARAAVRQCATLEMATAWILENADQVAQIVAESGAGSDAGAAEDAAEDERAASAANATTATSSTRVACGRILMWLGPQGDLEQNKGHTGSFYELRTLANRRMLEVYLLYECGRRMQRRLVFSSDTRFSLADLPIDTESRDRMKVQGMKHSGGNVFAAVIDESGAKARRPGAGDMYGAQVDSLTIRRRRSPSVSEAVAKEALRLTAERWGERAPVLEIPSEWDYEEIVPDEMLCGLLPSAAIAQYQYWRTGDATIRGYAYPNRGRSDDAATTLLVILAVELDLVAGDAHCTLYVPCAATAAEVWSAVSTRCGDEFANRCRNAAGVALAEALPRGGRVRAGDSHFGRLVATAHRFVELDPAVTLSAGRKEDEAAALAKHAASYPPPLLLLNLLRAPLDSPLYTMGLLLSRIENGEFSLYTVISYANLTHNLTRSP